MNSEKLKNSLKIYALIVLILANALVWYAVFREDRQGVLTVSFLDVGQGDSIFIDAPNGNQILLDGGPDKKVLRELSGVMPFYDREIDLLAFSHPHMDHITGLIDVLNRYSVAGFLSSGTKTQTPEYFAFRKYLEAQPPSEIKEIIAERGMTVDLGDDVYLDVLLPVGDATNLEPHDGMMVTRLRYGNTAILFTGDMEQGLENYLVSLDGTKLKSDILKVGHHGSKTSTYESLLGNVSPKYAVISDGKNNSYHHPNPETLKRLTDFGIPILRTDESGTITFKSDGERIAQSP